jgi:phospholipase/carboxylesterase
VERSAANERLPIFMAHGTSDNVLPLALGESSRRTLEAQGYAVEWHAYPMTHSVCREEVSAIGAWLTALPRIRS